MKHLKVTSALLSAAMCMSMVMAPVTVMADETTATEETQIEETEKQEAKETEKPAPKETEKPSGSETEKQEPKETQKEEPAESEKEEPSESEKQESEEKEPEVSEEPKFEDEDFADAANALVSGVCGKSVRFSLAEDGTLKIWGKGAMYEKTECPWKSYSSHIKKVIIYKGVTTICQGAFFECNYLTSVSLPGTLKSIGTAALGLGPRFLIVKILSVLISLQV